MVSSIINPLISQYLLFVIYIYIYIIYPSYIPSYIPSYPLYTTFVSACYEVTVSAKEPEDLSGIGGFVASQIGVEKRSGWQGSYGKDFEVLYTS
jgi:hypothetical protein